MDPSDRLLVSASTYSLSPSVSKFVIGCWLLSLLLSISCALVALSLRRWAQPRTWVTSPRYSLLEQARLRTLLSDRTDRLNFVFLVGVLHGLVHFSFSVFLVGLFGYFADLDASIPFLASLWIVLSILVYAYFTALPLSGTAHPSSSPLINFVVVAIFGFYYGFVRLLYLVTLFIRDSEAAQGIFCPRKKRFINWYLDFTKFAEEKAQELAPYLDDDVLRRTFDMLRSDDDLEQFFEAIPGYCLSGIVDNPGRSLDILGQQRLAEALVAFWNRTLSSNRLSESVKGRRLVVCARVIEATNVSIAVPWILHIFSGDLRGLSGLVEMGYNLGILRHGNSALFARGIIARIISINDERDKRWKTLAMDELEISEDVLRRYLSSGDSVLLANLVHITRLFLHGLRHDSDIARKSLNILPSVSKFDILSTLPELQHEFCALWNEIVEQNRISGANGSSFTDILDKIRDLHDALHRTDAALTASAAENDGLCRMPDHDLQDVNGSPSGVANHSTTATSSTLPLHTATGIVQGIIVTSLNSSTAEPIAQSSSGTGSAPRPDEGITVSSMLFDSAVIRPDYICQERESPFPASTISLSHSESKLEAVTISGPNITRRTASVSSASLRTNGNPHNSDPTIQSEPTQHPGESGASVIGANSLRPQDHDSSETTV